MVAMLLFMYYVFATATLVISLSNAFLVRSQSQTNPFAPEQAGSGRIRNFLLTAIPNEDSLVDDPLGECSECGMMKGSNIFLQDGYSRRDFLLQGSTSTGAGILSLLYASSSLPALAADNTGQISRTTNNQGGKPSPNSSSGTTGSFVIPYSSVRKYKSITLGNGMQVLLVSDRMKLQSQAALTIGGAGQFSNPSDLDGLAHLMEHMILSSTNRSGRKSTKDFEEWVSDYDGSSNGFTAFEKVCFHFNCRAEAFPEALERFARLFLQEVVQKTCRDEFTLKREIRRVGSEIDGGNDFTRELYLTKSLINQSHPYARLSAGNLQTLETHPTNDLGIDVGEELIKFFKERYQPSKAVLVVVSPSEISSLEAWVAPFASTMSRQRDVSADTEQKRVFPEFFPQRSRLSTICLFRRKGSNPRADDLEKLSFQWALDLDYSGTGNRDIVTATQIGFIISQIISRRGPGSLYALLKRRNWIPEGTQGIPKISFPVDVTGFQIMKLQLTLTLQGFSSRSAVIAAVYDSINSIQNSPLSSGSFLLRRELIAEYCTSAKLYGYVLAPRPRDAIELAFDAQIYGVTGTKGVGNPEWRIFPPPQDKSAIGAIQKALQDVFITISDPSTAIIITTASKKAILFAERNLLESSLPPMSPASWNISPVTGARYYFDNMIRLSGRANEWLVSRLMEDELSPPVLNPLIPAILRPPRYLDTLGGPNSSIGNDPLVLAGDDTTTTTTTEESSKAVEISPFRRWNDKKLETYTIPDDATKTSIVRDYWAVLRVMSHDSVSYGLPLPRIPPEPSPRSVFVLQLISSRPARADTRKAAHAELWKWSLVSSASDLAELGVPAGLSYDISFNKFGMRICFLGLSQNIPSYARRFCRRVVRHQSKLLTSTDKLPDQVVESALRTAINAVNLSPRRRKEIVSILRESTSVEAALEGIAFFQSCGGGVCFTEGDILPKEAISLLGDLKTIFRSITGSNVRPTPAIPEVNDILYRPNWMPRSASSCATAGANLISDACGRVPR